MNKPIKEGWKYLANSPKWHYFRDGKSLCKRWMTLSDSGLEQGNNTSSDNCKSCRNKIMNEYEN
jgi:hypothetical protein